MRIFINQDEDGMFIAKCFDLPGCISQGETFAEAKANLEEAIMGYQESLDKHGENVDNIR